MNGNSIAIDTNIVIRVLRDQEPFIEWLRGFDKLYLPVPVLGELRYGALNSTRPAKELEAVNRFATRCQVLVIDSLVASRYGDLRHTLKRKGTPIPENDLWIAAICLQQAQTLATSDRHFAVVPDLTTLAPAT